MEKQFIKLIIVCSLVAIGLIAIFNSSLESQSSNILTATSTASTQTPKGLLLMTADELKQVNKQEKEFCDSNNPKNYDEFIMCKSLTN